MHSSTVVSGENGSSLLRFSILNRKQRSTLALIHGLFASEGYWLRYLTRLKDYRLLLVGVAYDSDKFNLQSVSAALGEMCKDENVRFLVGHSIGASLVRLTKAEVQKVVICDASRATRLSMVADDQLLPSPEKKPHSEVESALANARLICAEAQKDTGEVDVIMTPTDDDLFSYVEQPNFEGTHFDIEAAIVHLLTRLDE